MNSFGIADLAGLQKKLKGAGITAEKVVIGVLIDETIKSYKVTLEATPQYSGYLASNLRIIINGYGAPSAPDLRADHEAYGSGAKITPKKKGDPTAMEIANSYNRASLESRRGSITMNSRLGVTYYAPYWETIEAGTNLRDVNKPGQAMAKGEARVPGVYSWEQAKNAGREVI